MVAGWFPKREKAGHLVRISGNVSIVEVQYLEQ